MPNHTYICCFVNDCRDDEQLDPEAGQVLPVCLPKGGPAEPGHDRPDAQFCWASNLTTCEGTRVTRACEWGGDTLVDGGSLAHGELDDHQICTWTMTCSNAAEVPQLTFSVFETESCCDFLNIYDADNTDGVSDVRFHGLTAPTQWSGTSSIAIAEYVSDGPINRAGFAGTYTCVDPATVTPVTPTPTSTTLCAVNEKVTSNVCVPCSPGTRLKGGVVVCVLPPAIGRDPLHRYASHLLMLGTTPCPGTGWAGERVLLVRCLCKR